MVNKNDCCTLEIIDLGVNGEGIGKIDGFTVFVNNALPGEVVKVLMVKVKKSYGYGKLLEIVKSSPFRVEPKCAVAAKCGGCNLQHLDYEQQLKLKRKMVADNLERIGGFKDIFVNPVLGMDNPYHYRNKAQYPVGEDKNGVAVGFYAAASHRIIPCENCLIGHKDNEKILKLLEEFIYKFNIKPYNEENHTGTLRHIMIRQGFKTNETMVCLVINGTDFKYKKQLAEIMKNVSDLTSVILNYNTKKSNVILGDKCETVFGRDYITDYIGNLKFNISPLSFFQVNPTQTEKLYNTALEFANLKGDEVVVDAYCGTGTITLFLAQKAKKVYGVEIVPEAIENAKINALNNNVENAEFYTGKAEDVVPWLCKEKNVNADVVIVDPPRKGCDDKLLELINTVKPKRVVYVSCNSATLARDLKTLGENYVTEQVQPVDMFPHTCHVESVVLMSKIKE